MELAAFLEIATGATSIDRILLREGYKAREARKRKKKITF